jgi:hypothetical protein
MVRTLLGFAFGPAPTRSTTDPVRCPNGDATQDGQCLLPVRHDPSLPNSVAFDCINPPGNVPQTVFDTDGDGSGFPDAPATDGRTDVDGRAYNLILRKPDGTIALVDRIDPSRNGVVRIPVVAGYYRIHSTRSLLLPPNRVSNICRSASSDDQIGCLTLASPCSIGFTGRSAVANNPGAVSVLVNGIPDSTATIRAAVSGGVAYPLARKLYVNSVRGFEFLHNTSATVPNTDAEDALLKCFAKVPFNGGVNVDSPSIGLVRLPPGTGATVEKPLCEDFLGTSFFTCQDISNTDACLGNELISDGSIPTSFCNNGLKDGAETAPDVCQAGTSCNATTHHCQ